MKTLSTHPFTTASLRCITGLFVGLALARSLRAETPRPSHTIPPATLVDFLMAGATPIPSAPTGAAEGKPVDAFKEHSQLFVENQYPSAATCRTCHPGHYREWSASPHAYAQLSPIFNAMHGTIVKQSNGSNGDFCIRCHTQVGMNLGESVFMSNMDRNPTSREGISCIVCHRMKTPYGKVSGRFALEKGDLLEPVYGPQGNAELARTLAQPNIYRVVTNRTDAGRKIHTEARQFFQLTEPAFCGTCHDVTLMNGFRLEEAFSSYKHAPASRAGVTCSDCHMGLIPGIKSGYSNAPAAFVGGVPTKPRKRTHHTFVGPDYSIIHPGLFPHNDKAAALATMREWLTFDYKAGWGTDAFEDKVAKDFEFPPRWKAVDDRYDARAILIEQFQLLEEVQKQRVTLLQNAYQLGSIQVTKADKRGLNFKVQFKNVTDGHNAPVGFDAERPVWLHVVVTDPLGKVVYESGDLDPNGDLRDLHSTYVHHNDLPLDRELFSLQSKFITRNFRGGEREQVLAINYSIDPLPYVRPEPFSTILTGRPGGARAHRMGIEPLGERWPSYKVPAKALTGEGPYKIALEIKYGMVPVNLITEIQVVGFDYNMSPREVADAVRAGQTALWHREVEVRLNGDKPSFDLSPTSTTNTPARKNAQSH